MIKKISNFTALKHIIDKLSKIFSSYRLFYAFLFFLPLGIDKIWLSQKSYYYGYFSFYNTFYLNFTDFLFLGVMTAWLWEKISQKSTPPSLPYSSGGNEVSNPSYSPPKIEGDSIIHYSPLLTRRGWPKAGRGRGGILCVSLIILLTGLVVT